MLGLHPRGRRSGLPVHDRHAAVGSGEDRVDPPSDGDPVKDRLDGDLDIDRGAGGPLAGQELGLERRQLGIRTRVVVRRPGQLARIEQCCSRIVLFHPGVEGRPPTCGESGLGGHGPPPLAGEALRVVGQLHEIGGREMPRHLHHCWASLARGGPLGEQKVDVGGIRVADR